MPMSGSNYVAPTWVNGGPPALDAAELQAMCDTIVKNQGNITSLQSSLASLTTKVGEKAKIQVTTYVGTGTSGPVTVNFNSKPTIVFIVSEYSELYGIFVYGLTREYITTENGSLFNTVNWTNNSMNWTCNTNSAKYAYNISSITYHVVYI